MAYTQPAALTDDLFPDQPAAAAPPDHVAEAQGHLAWLVSAARSRGRDSYQFLLLLRFTVINLVAFGLLGAAGLQGYLDRVLAADTTHLSAAIFVVFLAGFGISLWLVVRTSRELNVARDFDPLVPSRAGRYLADVRGRSAGSRAISGASVRLDLISRIGVVRHIANSLVLLGLIGTVIGFIIALAGVEPGRASDIDNIGPMVSTLIQGMSIALYTTLVGAVMNVWLMVNYHLLARGTVKLVTAIVELGERHART